MSKRRAFLLVLVIASTTLGSARASGRGAAGEPTITLSVGAASSGQEVDVTGSDWPATAALTVMVCGQGSSNSTENCDVLGGQTVVTDRAGGFGTPLVVRIPPAPCPCVVWAFSASTDRQVITPIAIVGAPQSPPSTGDQSTIPPPTDQGAEDASAPRADSSEGLAWLLAIGVSVALVVLTMIAVRIARHLDLWRRRTQRSVPERLAIGPGTRELPPARTKPIAALARPAATQPESNGKVPVVFTLPDAADARTVSLCGDFNGWAHEAMPLHRCRDRWTVTLPLEPGRSYRYQFLVDGRWETGYRAGTSTMPNPFETWYSIVTVRPIDPASARPGAQRPRS